MHAWRRHQRRQARHQIQRLAILQGEAAELASSSATSRTRGLPVMGNRDPWMN